VEEGGVFHGQSIMDAGTSSGAPSSSGQAAAQGAAAAEKKDPGQVKV
jgi:hypothetical protein